MVMLSDVDKPGSDIDKYVNSLDAILLHKMELIGVVRQRLIDFYTHIKMEENLQKLYQQNALLMDCDNEGGRDEGMLLDSQNDDFDHMDEANINCPDEFGMTYHHQANH